MNSITIITGKDGMVMHVSNHYDLLVKHRVRDYMDRTIRDLYLRDTWTVNVSDDFWKGDQKVRYTEDGLKNKICASYKRIVKRLNTAPELVWKVVSSTRATYFILSNLQSNNYIHAIDFVDNPRYYGTFSFTFEIDISTGRVNENTKMRTYIGYQFMGKQVITNMFRAHSEECDILQLISESLKLVRDLKFEKDIDTEFSENHTEMEMDIFRTAFYDYNKGTKKDCMLCRSILGFMNGDLVQERQNVSEMSIHMDELTFLKEPGNVWDSVNVPIIDLTKKDWQFINNWATKNGMLRDTEISTNLFELARDQPYGCKFKDAQLGESGTEFEFIENLELFESENLARFEFIYEIDSIRHLYITVDIKNANSFTLPDDVMGVYVSMFVNITKDMLIPSGIEETRELSPHGLLKKERIIWIMLQYFLLLMILKNRPTQYRVISESPKTNEIQKPKSKKSNNRSVKRILKTAYAAKNYIREMSENKADREYTMERWTRREHDRHLKNGKVVHIGAQKCTRRLPIAQKEIHIKL